MTITIGQGAEIILAFVGGAITVVLALVLLVAFGNWHVHMEWMSPSRAAGLRRFFKLLFFPVLGVVVTNAATWTATLLVSGLHVDPALANAGGLIVGAAIGGVSGAGAGTAVQTLTKGQKVKIPSETRLQFTLQQPVKL